MLGCIQEAQLPLWLRPYEVLVTSNRTALIELIPDSLSIHTIKAKSLPGTSLRDHFMARHGQVCFMALLQSSLTIFCKLIHCSCYRVAFSNSLSLGVPACVSTLLFTFAKGRWMCYVNIFALQQLILTCSQHDPTVLKPKAIKT